MVTQAWWAIPDWWAAGGTILAVVVAIFHESFWAWFRRPKLDLSVSVAPPDCVKTIFTDNIGRTVADCYYFRVLVKNTGKRRADEVELYAEGLEIQENNGIFRVVKEFPPMDFLWSHLKKPLQSISPGLQKHCDLGYITGPNKTSLDERIDQLLGPISQFCFELEVKPNQGGWCIKQGTYRLHVALAAANASVQRRVLEIRFQGQWMDEERDMFARGIDIQLVPTPLHFPYLDRLIWFRRGRSALAPPSVQP